MLDGAPLSDVSASRICMDKRDMHVVLESVLTGHDDWIYSVRWSDDSRRLLTASMDKFIIIWMYDDVLLAWIEQVCMCVSG
jgi:elongator complex protein 2